MKFTVETLWFLTHIGYIYLCDKRLIRTELRVKSSISINRITITHCFSTFLFLLYFILLTLSDLLRRLQCFISLFNYKEHCRWRICGIFDKSVLVLPPLPLRFWHGLHFTSPSKTLFSIARNYANENKTNNHCL